MGVLDFFKVSSPSEKKVPADSVDKTYKKLRFSCFVAVTLAYSFYYVCRTTLNVVKKPIIDAGLLDAKQLGIVGSCLLFAYGFGKFVNGLLVDHSNTKRFMAFGLLVSTVANMIMGVLGFASTTAGISSMVFFGFFAVLWAVNGYVQSVGAPSSIVSLTRWYPMKIRGTYYGFFSASHNFGEWMSFLLVGLIVANFGWQWGFFGATIAGVMGLVIILLMLHDTPESKGLPSVEELAGEEPAATEATDHAETVRIQKAVFRNSGVWILAAAAAFMYVSRYAVNSWGVIFLQEQKGFDLKDATFIVSINALLGIIGTVFSGWLTDKVFNSDRKIPAFAAGILEVIALVLFLFGGNGWFINVLAMVLFGIAIGVLISFLGGLMAIDLVPRKATGAALGIVGMAGYLGAGIQDIVSGVLIDGHSIVNEAGERIYDFTPASWFWIAAATLSFLLPVLNWKRKQQQI
ncbi:MAG: MFS transporter [Bacteroidales bacterium]|nr:MFS transporter [Bacteroidales bacterium]